MLNQAISNKYVAFYLRSATGNLEDLKRQRRILDKELGRRKADFADWPIEIYIDSRHSGMHPGPEFLRMSCDIKDGKVAVVMVTRLNRISRSVKGMCNFYEFVRTENFRFLSIYENTDSLFFHNLKSNCEVAHESR